MGCHLHLPPVTSASADVASGFGEHGHDPQSPNGARIAVSFVLNYEEGGERNPLDGDKTSEEYLWEKGPSGGGREYRHLNGEQDFEYGSQPNAVSNLKCPQCYLTYGNRLTASTCIYLNVRNT